MNVIEARDILVELFTLDDVPRVCAFVGCDFEELRANTKTAYFRELIGWLERRSKYNNLIQLIQFVQLLMVRMNSEEVKTVAFDLGLHSMLDDSGSRTKASLIMHLLYLIQLYGIEKQFQQWLQKQRPDIFNQSNLIH